MNEQNINKLAVLLFEYVIAISFNHNIDVHTISVLSSSVLA